MLALEPLLRVPVNAAVSQRVFPDVDGYVDEIGIDW